MKKRIIALLLAVIMCTELLAGCGTAIITDTGTDTVADSSSFTDKEPTAEKQAELDHLYCVSWNGTDYIYGYIYDTLTKKPVEGAKVTLVDAKGEPISDKKGKPCTDTTWSAADAQISGPNNLSPEVGSFHLYITHGEDASYERNYFVKIERPKYATMTYPVTYIDWIEYQKFFEKLVAPYLTGENGILENTRLIKFVVEKLDVAKLLEMGRNSSEYGDVFVWNSILNEDKLKDNQREFLAGAGEIEKLEEDSFNEGFWKPVWNEVADNITRSWGEWLSGMWGLLPERLQAQIMIAGAYGYTYGEGNNLEDVQPFLDRGNEKMPEGNFWNDEEYMEFGKNVGKAVAAYLAEEAVTDAALAFCVSAHAGIARAAVNIPRYFKRFKLVVNKGLDNLVPTNPGAVVELAGVGRVSLRTVDDIGDGRNVGHMAQQAGDKVEEMKAAMEETMNKMEETGAGRQINAKIDEQLGDTSKNGAEMQEMYLKEIDRRKAENQKKADEIRDTAEARKQERIREMETELAARGKRLEELKRALYEPYQKDMPEDLVTILMSDDPELCTKMAEQWTQEMLIKEKGEEYALRLTTNHEIGHALSLKLLNNRNMARLNRISIEVRYNTDGKVGDYGHIDFHNWFSMEGGNPMMRPDYESFYKNRWVQMMAALGSSVTEDLIYKRMVKGAMYEFGAATSNSARKAAQKMVEYYFENIGRMVDVKIRNQLGDLVLMEFYGRMKAAFAQFIHKGVYDELSQKLLERGTIDGAEFTAWMDEIFQKTGLEELCDSSRWMQSEVLKNKDALIRQFRELNETQKEYDDLVSAINREKKADALTPEDRATLSGLTTEDAQLDTFQREIEAWPVQLNPAEALGLLQKVINMRARIVLAATAYGMYAKEVDARDKGLGLPPLLEPTKLEGSIVDKMTGEAISYASCSLYYTGDASNVSDATNLNPAGEPEGAPTFLDTEGNFSFAVDKAGWYTLYVTADGYDGQSISIKITEEDTPVKKLGKIKLAPQWVSLEGRVVDAETEEAIPSATIEVYCMGNAQGMKRYETESEALTGEFDVALPVGVFRAPNTVLMVSAKGYEPITKKCPYYRYVEKQQIGNIELKPEKTVISKEKTSLLKGLVVRAEDLKPVEGADVCAYPITEGVMEEVKPAGKTSTGASGTASLTLPAGRYRLTITAAGYESKEVDAVVKEDRMSIFQEVRLRRVYEVRGIIRDAKDKKLLLEGAAVQFEAVNAEESMEMQTVSGEEGKYSIYLPTGTYKIRVTAEDYREYRGRLVVSGGKVNYDVALSRESTKPKDTIPEEKEISGTPSPRATATPSLTPKPKATVTPSATPKPKATATPSATPSPTPSPIPTVKPTPTVKPRVTPSPAPSVTPSPSPIPSEAPRVNATVSPTVWSTSGPAA